jgi:hypothetical protein
MHVLEKLIETRTSENESRNRPTKPIDNENVIWQLGKQVILMKKAKLINAGDLLKFVTSITIEK